MPEPLHIKVPRYNITDPDLESRYRIGKVINFSIQGVNTVQGTPAPLRGRVVCIKDNGPDKDADVWLNIEDPKE